MKVRIGGYDYFDKKSEAEATIKSTDDVLAYEVGLGWYTHSRKEYARDPLKRIFGF